MQRRTFLAGTGACLLAAPSIAAASTGRRFKIWRNGDVIGSHIMEAVGRDGQFEIEIEILIAVKVLGITAFRYELRNREVWKGGSIVSVDSKVHDDGDKEFAKVTAKNGALQVNGSRHSGEVSPDAVTTSYFAKPFLRRAPWISTQSGDPLDVSIAPVGGRAGWHQVTGGLRTTLGYDGNGEWTGCEFDAGGELATYDLEGPVGNIAKLWSGA